METDDLDVIVVGSGPAGSTAAAVLAAAGARVVVVEKHTIPRYKPCGGGVVGRAFDSAPAEVRASEESTACRARMTFSDLPSEYRLEADRPLVHLVMRDRFDEQLLRRAQGLGAHLLEACTVQGAQKVKSGWQLDTSRGPLRAPLVVAADGVQSRLARAAGWQAIAHRAPALEWEIGVDDASMQRVANEVRFDFDSALQGYAWVFPKRHRLSVGILSTRRGARDLTGSLLRYLESQRLRPRSIEKHAWMIPLAPRGAQLARDGLFLVGDAAGLVDPVTCEGISAALSSGDLVGRCLQEAALDARAAQVLYERQLQAGLLNELRWARRLTRVLYGPRWVRRLLFAHCGPLLCEAMGSVISGRQTYQALLSRPRNLRRLLLHRRPAASRIDLRSDTST